MDIKWCVLRLAKQAMVFSYKLMTRFSRVKADKVVVFYYREWDITGNLQVLIEEIRCQFPETKLYVACAAKKFNYQLVKNLWCMRDASKVIVDDYFLAAYVIIPRPETAIIQLWHAAGAFKKFGLSTKNTRFGPTENYLKIIPIHSHYTQVYVSTKIAATYFAQAFGMKQEQLTVLGMPRVEPLLARKLQQPHEFTEQQQPMLKVLVAPTYRAKAPKSESTLDWLKEIQALLKEIPPQLLIIVVLHPYEEAIARWQVIGQHPQLIVDSKNSSNAWMAQADCFITDYSSALFEFALFERPLANYVPDLQSYEANRGLYRPLREITAGDILTNRSQLVSWVLARRPNEFKNTARMVQENIGPTTQIAQKIVAHMFKEK